MITKLTITNTIINCRGDSSQDSNQKCLKELWMNQIKKFENPCSFLFFFSSVIDFLSSTLNQLSTDTCITKSKLKHNVRMTEVSFHKIPKFHLISWCWNFVEKHNLRRVLCDSPTKKPFYFHKMSTLGN